MRKYLYTFCLFFSTISISFVNAQNLDIGLNIGTSHYYGDVVNEFTPSTLGSSFGLFARYRLSGYFTAKATLGVVNINGDDQYSSSSWQINRNWAFKTSIYEFLAQAEYNFIEDRNRGRRFANPFIPYISAGIGYISFSPTAELTGTTYALAPPQLSGYAYSTSALVVPVALGARAYLSRSFQLGFELGFRYTTTSHLDDIAPGDVFVDPNVTPNPKLTRLFYGRAISVENNQKGDLRSKMGNFAKTNYNSNGLNEFLGKYDMYFVPTITLAYTIGGSGGGGRRSGGGSFGKAIRCPRFF